jgi:hypothetical protein
VSVKEGSGIHDTDGGNVLMEMRVVGCDKLRRDEVIREVDAGGVAVGGSLALLVEEGGGGENGMVGAIIGPHYGTPFRPGLTAACSTTSLWSRGSTKALVACQCERGGGGGGGG